MEMTLSEWLQRKYINWLSMKGEIKSQREFADFLDIDKVALSRYFNGIRRNPDPDTVIKFADKLGPEIYDILGLARPDPQLKKLTSVWHKLDQHKKDKILRIAEEEEEYKTG